MNGVKYTFCPYLAAQAWFYTFKLIIISNYITLTVSKFFSGSLLLELSFYFLIKNMVGGKKKLCASAQSDQHLCCSLLKIVRYVYLLYWKFQESRVTFSHDAAHLRSKNRYSTVTILGFLRRVYKSSLIKVYTVCHSFSIGLIVVL